MPGWIGHEIKLSVRENIKPITLPEPCDIIAQEVNNDLMNVKNRVQGGMGGLVEELALLSQSYQVSALAGFGSNKTGRLAGSITPQSGGNSAHIGTDLYYASYVNDGRGGITAVGKALHFYIGGAEVFTKSVGPAAPRPYVDVSGTLLESSMDSLVSSYMESLL